MKMCKNTILALMVTLSLSGCSTAIKYGLQEQGIGNKVDRNVKYCEYKTGPYSTAWKPCK